MERGPATGITLDCGCHASTRRPGVRGIRIRWVVEVAACLRRLRSPVDQRMTASGTSLRIAGQRGDAVGEWDTCHQGGTEPPEMEEQREGLEQG